MKAKIKYNVFLVSKIYESTVDTEITKFIGIAYAESPKEAVRSLSCRTGLVEEHTYLCYDFSVRSQKLIARAVNE